MERGNGNTVLLTVIGVATLLVALVGATFAYFTATVTDSSTPVNVTTTQVAGMELRHYESATPSPAYPGLMGYDVLEVHATGSGSATYNLSVAFAQGNEQDILSDVQYKICGYNSSSALTINDTYMGYTPGTATYGSRNVSGTTVNDIYYINGATVAMPDACTGALKSITEWTTATGTNATIQLSAASGTQVTAGTYDYYFIIYKYNDNDAQQTAGQTFTITPTFAAMATTTGA